MPDDAINEIVWQVVATIPEGKVLTYGQVAQAAGYPKHARYVGHILKKLPARTKLPWHRVVNSRGELSFPKDSTPYTRQRSRLLAEGIQFSGGKLSLKRYSALSK